MVISVKSEHFFGKYFTEKYQQNVTYNSPFIIFLSIRICLSSILFVKVVRYCHFISCNKLNESAFVNIKSTT